MQENTEILKARNNWNKKEIFAVRTKVSYNKMIFRTFAGFDTLNFQLDKPLPRGKK